MIDLIVRLRADPAAEEYVFRLQSDDGVPSASSNLPDPQAALAAVEKFGEQVFFPQPGPPRLCTQQYGGPQMAVVTGTFHGRPVDCGFSRTDGCEISRWNTMAALLGGGSAS
jgi:aminoglycoside phosphotransferase (APT) family kinase protein